MFVSEIVMRETKLLWVNNLSSKAKSKGYTVHTVPQMQLISQDNVVFFVLT